MTIPELLSYRALLAVVLYFNRIVDLEPSTKIRWSGNSDHRPGYFHDAGNKWLMGFGQT
jgi:hypothetical protein